MRNNPALVVQRHVVNVSRTEISRQNAGHYPTLDAVLRKSNRDTQGTLFGGGSEVETQELMLRLSVPLYAGGSVSSKTREAQARYQIIIDDPVAVSRAMTAGLENVRQYRREHGDAYYFNWRLKIDAAFQANNRSQTIQLITITM